MNKESKRKRKDPRIESEYYEDMEMTCPITGKITVQKVKITRYKSAGVPKIEGKKGLPDEEVDVELEEYDVYSCNEEED